MNSHSGFLNGKGTRRRGQLEVAVGCMDRTGRLYVVGCIYGLLAWIYSVAMQLSDWRVVYEPVTWWLPIRIDYFGEIGFVISFLFAVALALRHEDENRPRQHA